MARDVNSIRDYWQKLAKEQGLSEKAAAAVLEVLADEAAGKAFASAFVPQSDYSRDLDKTRDEWKGKADEAVKKVSEYDKWYNDQAKPAYERGLLVEKELKKYTDTFGSLEDGAAAKPPADVVTKKDFEEAIARMSGNTASVMKDLSRVTLDHFKRFGEALDPDELEKFAVEKGLPIRAAYEALIAPKEQARQNVEWEAKVKAAREEGARDALSRYKLPVDPKPREHHAFFDRKEPSKDMTPLAQERAAREAFLDAFNNAETANR